VKFIKRNVAFHTLQQMLTQFSALKATVQNARTSRAPGFSLLR
jgi:hypothetical protein